MLNPTELHIVSATHSRYTEVYFILASADETGGGVLLWETLMVQFLDCGSVGGRPESEVPQLTSSQFGVIFVKKEERKSRSLTLQNVEIRKKGESAETHCVRMIWYTTQTEKCLQIFQDVKMNIR